MKTNNFPPVQLSRSFTASPETVFDAWLNPSQIRRWMFVSGTNEIVEVKSDCRVGGQFSILERNQGEMIDHYGIYREINRPHRLAFTLEVPRHFPGVTCITIEITRQNSGSLMAFTQTASIRKSRKISGGPCSILWPV
jgi:uncharacterized protein YndB with AHSA1/START domain